MEREKTRYRESSWSPIMVTHFRDDSVLSQIVAVRHMEVDKLRSSYKKKNQNTWQIGLALGITSLGNLPCFKSPELMNLQPN